LKRAVSGSKYFPICEPAAPTARAERLSEAQALAARCAAFVDSQVTTFRTTTLARMACEIEVASDPELREILHTGDRFRAMDRALKDAGRLAYDAVQRLVVDTHWLPDDDPDWLARLIGARMVDGDAKADAGPSAGDFAYLGRAIEGLLALGSGRRR